MSGISLHQLCVRLLASAMLLTSAGCATFWEEAWSRERDFAYMTGIGKPAPLVVLRDSNNGLRRGQAFAELKEPLQNGGNAQDQEAYLKILEAAALGIYDSEKDAAKDEPYCRLTAIRALGKFRDPRAARILEEVYQQPTRNPDLPHQKHGMPFTPDNNNLIRKEALVALASMRDDNARHLLIRVARQPGPPVDVSFNDAQRTQDEKLVAIRALGKYRQQECADALMFVLKTERDIALRDRALASLEEMTGKRYPMPIEAWQSEEIRPQPGSSGSDFIQRVGAWFKQ